MQHPQLSHLGSTRSSLKADHLLQTPDTFVRTPLPGAEAVEFIVHIAPQRGAAFTQMTAEFATGGMLGPAPAQRFIYVLEGKLDLIAAGKKYVLTPGRFAYLPQGAKHTLRARTDARAAIIEKLYEPAPDESEEQPRVVVGNEADIPATPLMGDESLRVRSLMPDGPGMILP